MSNIPFNYYGVPAEVTPSGIRMMIFPNTTQYDVVILRATGTLEPSQSDFMEIARIPNTQLSEQGTLFEDILPVDGIQRWYDFYQTAEGFATSSWFSGTFTNGAFIPVTSTPMQGTYTQNPTNPKPAATFAVASTDAAGTQLAVGVTQTTLFGSQSVITKGHQDGKAQHYQYVSFSPVFDTIPAMFFDSGISHQPLSLWTTTASLGTGSLANNGNPEYQQFTALNLSTMGFTCSAVLMQKGSGTQHLQSGSYTGSTGGHLPLSASGQYASSTASFAPSYDSNYSCTYSASLEVDGNDFQNVSATAVVAIDTYDAGSWTQRAQKSYSVSGVTTAINTWASETQSINVSGLTSSDIIRIRVASLTFTGNDVILAVPVGKLLYRTLTGASNQYTSMTPNPNDSSDYVNWHAFEVDPPST